MPFTNALKPAAFVRRFVENADGNFAMLSAIATMSLALTVGLAVDTAVLRKERQNMQSSADVISLAIAKEELTRSGDMIALGNSFLDARYGNNAVTITDARKTGDEYSVELSQTAGTIFMKLLNKSTVDLRVSSTTTYERLNLDLSLVLDNTGSMRGRKLAALKTASNTLVDTLMDGQPSAAGTQIGLVPFAQWVNVGADGTPQPWLDIRGQSSQNQTYFDSPVSRVDLYNSMGKARNGCVENRLPPYDIDDTTADPSDPNTLFQPAFHPDMADTQRGAYTYLADNSGGNSLARLRNTAKYGAALPAGALGPAFAIDTSCSDARREVTPLTNNKRTVKRAINAMYAQGYTNIANGAAWGFRAVSPNAPFTQGRPYSDVKTRKAMVILTDGMQTIGGPRGGFSSGYTPFGFLGEPAVNGKTRLTGTNAKSALDSKLLEVCAAAKAKGILVYTITFELRDAATKQTMQTCASNPAMYFDARSASELTPAFKKIASSLSSLRISG